MGVCRSPAPGRPGFARGYLAPGPRPKAAAASIAGGCLGCRGRRRRRQGGPARRVEGQEARRRPQLAGGVAGTDRFLLLRTAPVSSVPTESSHTASAAMLGQFKCLTS